MFPSISQFSLTFTLQQNSENLRSGNEAKLMHIMNVIWQVPTLSLVLGEFLRGSIFPFNPKCTYTKFNLVCLPLPLSVTLLISPVASPRIGPRSQVLVPVPVTAANGYTGFSLESLQMAVDEPLLPSPVRLRISRDGAYGEANVTWGVTFLNASTEDIGGTAGVETIPHGNAAAS